MKMGAQNTLVEFSKNYTYIFFNFVCVVTEEIITTLKHRGGSIIMWAIELVKVDGKINEGECS